MSESAAAAPPRSLSTQEGAFSFGTATGGKVGMWIFLLTDGMSFAGLLLAYGILRAGSHNWPDPSEFLGIGFTAVMTFVLICSSVSMVMALSAAQRKDKKWLCIWLAATVLGGLFFLCGQVKEYGLLGGGLMHEHHMTLSGQQFFEHFNGKFDIHFPSTFFIITGFHGMHVTTGVIYLTVTLIRAMMGRFTDGPTASTNHVEIAGLFWHFVDLVWILVFTFVYLV
jgi:heme/copper-type cytochrome/quinol oxidase subunit 3